jgi:enoyl-[acyl-carrier protein] reductase II
MRTRITELFEIEYPILLSGMSFISIPQMAAAVSNAGGLGLVATGPLSIENTRKAIKEIRSLTDKPFGMNVSLKLPGGIEKAAVLLEEKVPIINVSLGKGDWIAEEAHKYGGRVIATVVNHTHAKKAEDYGADALIVTGHEAGAHGGSITSLVLIPSIADSVKIPVIAAGGFSDGRGLAAALALGAEGIAMGTRFMTTQESPLHTYYKELSLKKSIYDTIYSDGFDGMASRIMDTEAARRKLKKGMDVFAAYKSSRQRAKEMNVPYIKLLMQTLSSGLKESMKLAHLAEGIEAIRIAIEDGNQEKGLLPAGQGVGLINDIPTVSELIERIILEAKTTQKKMGGQIN